MPDGPQPMSKVYVAEIRGRGIAAFNVDSTSAADDLVQDPAFRDDLMVLQSDGVPLWNGLEQIFVRQAHVAEDAKWRRSRARALRNGDLDDEEETWIIFLVALTDPDRRAAQKSARTRS
jgi:hypothetical protein